MSKEIFIEEILKKEYLSPELEIISISFNDVVCASGEERLFPEEIATEGEWFDPDDPIIGDD